MVKAYTPNIHSEKGKGLTKQVAEFVYKNKFNSIPKKVVELGKKHILDGFGLAIADLLQERVSIYSNILKKCAKEELQLLV